jgi:hypothetical protein
VSMRWLIPPISLLELVAFLQLAADEAETSVPNLLRRVFHVRSLADDPRFRQLFKTTAYDARALLLKLDHRLRVLNPGLHYVYRDTYLGYRREGGTTDRPVVEQRYPGCPGRRSRGFR